MIFRLRSVAVNNFMSIEKGDIVMPTSKDNYGFTSDILGIYGQNGSGKSSLIKALELLKYVFRQKSFSDDIENTFDFSSYITSGKDKASFSFIFDFYDFTGNGLPENLNGSLKYSFSLKAGSDYAEVFDEKIQINAVGDEVPAIKVKVGQRTHSNDLKEIIDLLTSTGGHAGKDNLLTYLEEYRKEAKPNTLSFFNQAFILNGNVFGSTIEYDTEEPENIWGNYSLLCELLDDFSYYLDKNVYIYGDTEEGEVRMGKIYLPYSFLYEDFEYHIDAETSKIEIVLATDEVERNTLNLIKKDIVRISKVMGCFFPGISFYIDEEKRLAVMHNGISNLFMNESYGVRKLFRLSGFLLRLYKEPSFILAVDEFDEGLFEYILGEILAALDDSGKGQMIFTAHNLRPLEVLKKNSIVFTTDKADRKFVTLKNLKPNHNLRDVYLRMLYMPDDDGRFNQEDLYNGPDVPDITYALESAKGIEYGTK